MKKYFLLLAAAVCSLLSMAEEAMYNDRSYELDPIRMTAEDVSNP